ncbi:hypothetical protein HDU91_002164, partial [Kappamyces sp. JEL0680]
PFLDPVTKRKFHFMNITQKGVTDTEQDQVKNESRGTGGWSHILEWVDPDQLLTQYGGNYEFEFSFDQYQSVMEIL